MLILKNEEQSSCIFILYQLLSSNCYYLQRQFYNERIGQPRQPQRLTHQSATIFTRPNKTKIRHRTPKTPITLNP